MLRGHVVLGGHDAQQLVHRHTLFLLQVESLLQVFHQIVHCNLRHARKPKEAKHNIARPLLGDVGAGGCEPNYVREIPRQLLLSSQNTTEVSSTVNPEGSRCPLRRTEKKRQSPALRRVSVVLGVAGGNVERLLKSTLHSECIEAPNFVWAPKP